jgi:hypothetical protein
MGLNLHKLFFYYRYGYSFYLAMILAAMNTMILIYFTAGDVIFVIRDTFPHFAYFVGFAVVVGVPTLITIGYLHYKRAYKNEVEVVARNNPHMYQLPPGHAIEVTYPLYMELLAVLKCFNPEPERKKRLEALEKKLQILLDGGKVGV